MELTKRHHDTCDKLKILHLVELAIGVLQFVCGECDLRSRPHDIDKLGVFHQAPINGFNVKPTSPFLPSKDGNVRNFR